ncbi:MAG: glyoxylate/hydroxypyruvate reductase A, partial [Marinovum sp.]|nr:glyoxylate/hydroxypyruvate reductase A [Marinovum sp.]
QDIAPENVDYIVYAPSSEVQDFTPFTRCKAVLNLWAGVEDVTGNPTLKVPLARMVDHRLTRGMVEWVVGHTLRHHLGMDAHLRGQDGEWRKAVPPLAENRRVTLLGLGALGTACAEALVALGFQMRGYSRQPKHIPGVDTFSAGGLNTALKGAEIVILLLPQTPQTENTLNAQTLSLLAPGAVVINPGRGPLIDDEALLDALESGALGHATLDVFRREPLPAEDIFWTHPKVTVTPHIASATRPETSAQVIAENIRRGENGAPFLHLVDRKSGY